MDVSSFPTEIPVDIFLLEIYLFIYLFIPPRVLNVVSQEGIIDLFLKVLKLLHFRVLPSFPGAAMFCVSAAICDSILMVG